MPDIPTSDLEWMALQVEVLFASDARGRLLRPSPPAEAAAPPPRFFLGRTRHGHLWRFGAGVPERTVAELARLAAAERVGWPLEQPPERNEPLRARLAADAPIEHTHHGPAFRFPELAPPSGGEVRALTPDRDGLVAEDFPALARELARRQPCLAALERGRVVSVCYVARRSAHAAEAGVDTLPGFRGRGLAARATAAWARAVADLGLLPLYSTEWRNRSSRGVAARLGLILYGVDLHFR
jgi:RimJ/RimL family protein N-acetyltransferase